MLLSAKQVRAGGGIPDDDAEVHIVRRRHIECATRVRFNLCTS